MTTYTLTETQMKECLFTDVAAYHILRSLKPNAQEPVAQRLINADGSFYFDEDPPTVYEQSMGWEALYTHPAPISKEDMVRVLELLKVYKDYAPPMAFGNTTVVEAITIMQSAIEGMK